jgi:short-subunit dehydrogenase
MARRPIHGLRTIVTGASSGIGRALVLELVRQGASVLAMARRADRLRDLQQECSTSLRCLAADVTQAADRHAALDLAKAEFGGLDALVNNAGSGALGRFDQADEARLRRIFEVNFFAPAEFIRAALPVLEKGRRPLIVNVGSVLGHRAMPEKSEYCASKFALHGLTDALRLELKTRNIDVLLVSPSTTRTEFFDTAGEPEASASGSPGARKARGNPYRLGAMSPETVARRIVRAMALGRRETILSAGGRALVWLDRLCPPLADWIIGRWG